MTLFPDTALPTLLEALQFMAARALGCFESEAHEQFGPKGSEVLHGLASHGFAREVPAEHALPGGRYFVVTEAGHRRLRAQEALETDTTPEPVNPRHA
jgi:hypothetical protein